MLLTGKMHCGRTSAEENVAALEQAWDWGPVYNSPRIKGEKEI